MTLKLNDQAVSPNEEFGSIKDVLGYQIAFKCTSWSGHVSDVLIKDIHYTGQEVAAHML